jgi:hypothetical protein
MHVWPEFLWHFHCCISSLTSRGSPVWPSECVETVNQFAKQSVESFEKLCFSHHYPFVIGKPYNHAADPRFEVVNWESGDGLTTTQP